MQHPAEPTWEEKEAFPSWGDKRVPLEDLRFAYEELFRIMDYRLSDRLIVPLRPSCGLGRTVFHWVKADPPIIVNGFDFKDWCDDCKRKLAEKLH
jgi:hypothetical protein